MSRWLVALMFMISVLAPQSARSERVTRPLPSAAQPATAAQKPQIWYGPQILLADLGVAILVAVALFGDGKPRAIGFAVSSGLFLLNGPVNHAAKGRRDAAVASLGMRAVPVLVAAGGFLASQSKQDNDVVLIRIATFVASVATMVLASAVDVGLLAWKPAESKDGSENQQSIRILPSVSPLEDSGATFGILGFF